MALLFFLLTINERNNWKQNLKFIKLIYLNPRHISSWLDLENVSKFGDYRQI